MTVLHFGALNDRSTFTSTDVHATDLRQGFFGGTIVVVKEVLSQARCVYLQLQEMS